MTSHDEVEFLAEHEPLFSGFFQMLYKNESHPGKSSTLFLPLLDLKAADKTTVRSTMEYVAGLARKFQCDPVLTFDQQIWWIAFMIQCIVRQTNTTHDLLRIVLILGGFHGIASFLGTMGNGLMAGSGLREALVTIYAEGSVDDIMSGKAIARATSAHLKVEAVLNTILSARSLETEIPTLKQFIKNECMFH